MGKLNIFKTSCFHDIYSIVTKLNIVYLKNVGSMLSSFSTNNCIGTKLLNYGDLAKLQILSTLFFH